MKNTILTVKNCGRIEIYNSINKSQGYKCLNEFLIKLSETLITRSTLYLKNVKPVYPAYAYSEKSFHTILTPAIDLITNKYLIESPIRRIAKGKGNKPAKNSHGWVDYWIGYENIEIFLELKHGWVTASPKPTNARKLIKKLWDVMNIQLDHLEHDAKEYQNHMKKSHTFFRIGMMILPFHQSSKKRDSIEEELTFQKIQKIQKIISDEIKPKPNWSGLFWMDSSFQKKLLVKEYDKFNYRPGFMILLNVKEIFKT